MIVGAPHYNDPKAIFNQRNNAVERILKKMGAREWLVSCGGESSAICNYAKNGGPEYVDLPGGGRLQVGDAIVLWMNYEANQPALNKVRNVGDGPFLGNEIMQWIPLAVDKVLGSTVFHKDDLQWDGLVLELGRGNSVQLGQIQPAHFIAAVAYDSQEGEVLCIDPNGGINRRLRADEYARNFYKKGNIWV